MKIVVHPPKSVHPSGDQKLAVKNPLLEAIEVDTYAGKIEIEWDSNAAVTPIGQLPFFIQFLKLGGRFDPWVEDCPLDYRSNNAPRRLMFWAHCFYPFCQDINDMPI